MTIVIDDFAIYTYYLVYHNTDEGRRRCRNMSVVKKLKVVVYVLKILTSLLLNLSFVDIYWTRLILRRCFFERLYTSFQADNRL